MTALGRSLFLVGFMGSGKSEVGRLLAATLGCGFRDTDASVEARAGRTIPELFRDRGEEHFRALEREVVEQLFAEPPQVVATGGGVFARASLRREMKRRGVTIWLDVPLEVARLRVGGGEGRPLWLADDPIALRTLFERRRAVYALAHLRVDAGLGGARLVARAALRALSASSPPGE